MITFNNKFNLIGNRNAVFHTQTRSKIQSLELEAETLHRGKCFIVENPTKVFHSHHCITNYCTH